jgi:hypothetical protein
MVSTPGAARGCSRGGRAQAGFAGGGRRSLVLLLGRTPAAGWIECWCGRQQGWSTWGLQSDVAEVNGILVCVCVCVVVVEEAVEGGGGVASVASSTGLLLSAWSVMPKSPTKGSRLELRLWLLLQKKSLSLHVPSREYHLQFNNLP